MVHIFVTFFLVPPPLVKRIIYENVTIIRSCVLKEIPIKLIIFWYPPPNKNAKSIKSSR